MTSTRCVVPTIASLYARYCASSLRLQRFEARLLDLGGHLVGEALAAGVPGRGL